MSAKQSHSRSDWVASAAAAVLVAIVLITVWHFAVVLLQLPKIMLPTPWQVAQAGWQQREDLIQGSMTTLLTACAGLIWAVVVGSAISIVFSQSKRLRRAFFPYVVFLQTVPIVAIAPLLIIWSGYEFRTAVIATVIICLFPIVNNVTTGLASASLEHQDLFRIHHASRWQTLIRLQIPTAIPYLVLGTRISSGLAVIGAIVAEFFVSNGANYEGLGAMMTRWQGLMQTDALMAALAMSTLLGLVLFGSVNGFAKLLLQRYLPKNQSAYDR
ncbi:MAG: ABC transporter permease [Planctomycetota bacterium]